MARCQARVPGPDNCGEACGATGARQTFIPVERPGFASFGVSVPLCHTHGGCPAVSLRAGRPTDADMVDHHLRLAEEAEGRVKKATDGGMVVYHLRMAVQYLAKR